MAVPWQYSILWNTFRRMPIQKSPFPDGFQAVGEKKGSDRTFLIHPGQLLLFPRSNHPAWRVVGMSVFQRLENEAKKVPTLGTFRTVDSRDWKIT